MMLKTYLMLLFLLASSLAYQNDDEPKKVYVKRGGRTNLPCGGFTAVKVGDVITWFKDGYTVTSYRVNNDEPTATQLLLTEVSDGDSGTYSCRVQSVAGPVSDHSYEVDVIVNVSIRTDNNDNFEAGVPRVLACVVYGCLPSPNVSWRLGNIVLRPNVYKEVNRGNFTVSSLTFIPSLTDNGKELVCKASNNNFAGTFEDKVTVSVGHRPICIDRGFKTIGAVEGESETLVCIVESDPEPEQFIWTFADGRTIYTSSKKLSGSNNRYSSTLVWVPREDDFGPLYCRASNRFGEQKQPCTFSVINGGPPTTPECKLFWEDQETLKVQCKQNWDGGRPQTIHIEVKDPEGTRKVSRKGHELKVNSLHRKVNSTVALYASNSRGKSSTIQLSVPGLPSDYDHQDDIKVHNTITSQWVVDSMYVAAGIFGVMVILCCLAYCYQLFKGCLCCLCCVPACCLRSTNDSSRGSSGGYTPDELPELSHITTYYGSPSNSAYVETDIDSKLPQSTNAHIPKRYTGKNDLATENYYV